MAEYPVRKTDTLDIPALDDAFARIAELESRLALNDEKTAQNDSRIEQLLEWKADVELGDDPPPPPDPDPPIPDPDPPTPVTFANLEAVGVSAADRWSTQPANITFVPEMQNDENGLRIGRLFVPRDGNWNTRAIGLLRGNERGAQHLALRAMYDSDETFNDLAKAHWQSGSAGYVYGGGGYEKTFAWILALDWIRWDSEEEFEEAAAGLIAIPHGNYGKHESLPKRGYYDNDAYLQSSGWMLETMLVAVCHGRPGPSGQWAAERLTHLSEIPNTSTWLMSPYEVANTLTVQSKDGGGRENAPSPDNKVGGYEQYFMTGGLLLWAWDTATGSSLFTDNLYFQTRADGFALEHDTNVEKYGPGTPDAVRMMSTYANRSQDGKAAWMANVWPSIRDHQTMLEFEVCSGQPPTEEPPAAEVTVRKAGSLWHYHENPADPDNSFRVAISCRDLDHYRYTDWDRCFGFAYKGVGLVMGGEDHRGHRVPTLANGLDLHDGRYEHSMHLAPYRQFPAMVPRDVATNPEYLVQEGGPEDVIGTGLYYWEQGWTHLVNVDGLSSVVTDWYLDENEKKLAITDEVIHDGSLTPRLCFSPNHAVTLNGDSFDITDGTDTVRVRVTSDTALTWDISSVPQKFNAGRIAQIVRATPAAAASHTFTTVIECL